MSIEIKLISSLDALLPYQAAWRALAKEVADPNPFYEDWCLLPAVSQFSGAQAPWYILGFATDTQAESPPLVLFFPIVEERRYKKLPFKHLSLWSHLHCFLHTPLVAKGYESACVADFFAWLLKTPQLPKRMVWKRIHGQGPFYTALLDFLTQHPRFFYHEEHYFRAELVRTYASYEEHLQAIVPRKKRRACEQRQEQLATLGELHYWQGLLDAQSAPVWADAFLEIEGSGWKGRANTALRCHDNEMTFFKQLLAEGAMQGKVEVSSLTLDQQLVAGAVRFKGNSAYFSFKVAYDENFAKYGPGFILLLKFMAQFYQNSTVEWCDSCADPHSIHEVFFAGRKKISTLLTMVRTLPTAWVSVLYTALAKFHA